MARDYQRKEVPGQKRGPKPTDLTTIARHILFNERFLGHDLNAVVQAAADAENKHRAAAGVAPITMKNMRQKLGDAVAAEVEAQHDGPLTGAPPSVITAANTLAAIAHDKGYVTARRVLVWMIAFDLAWGDPRFLAEDHPEAARLLADASEYLEIIEKQCDTLR